MKCTNRQMNQDNNQKPNNFKKLPPLKPLKLEKLDAIVGGFDLEDYAT